MIHHAGLDLGAARAPLAMGGDSSGVPYAVVATRSSPQEVVQIDRFLERWRFAEANLDEGRCEDGTPYRAWGGDAADRTPGFSAWAAAQPARRGVRHRAAPARRVRGPREVVLGVPGELRVRRQHQPEGGASHAALSSTLGAELRAPQSPGVHLRRQHRRARARARRLAHVEGAVPARHGLPAGRRAAVASPRRRERAERGGPRLAGSGTAARRSPPRAAPRPAPCTRCSAWSTSGRSRRLQPRPNRARQRRPPKRRVLPAGLSLKRSPGAGV